MRIPTIRIFSIKLSAAVPLAAQKLAQMAQLPIGPWAVDIYDEDQGVGLQLFRVMRGSHQSAKITSIDDNPITVRVCQSMSFRCEIRFK